MSKDKIVFSTTSHVYITERKLSAFVKSETGKDVRITDVETDELGGFKFKCIVRGDSEITDILFRHIK